MTVLFENVLYLAATSGATTKRTPATRDADIINVKDFGALGNNSHDDTSNIQAAVNVAIAAGGGTVFFPVGIYKITAPGINVGDASSFSITLLGAGGFASQLLGNFNGFIIDRNQTISGTPGLRNIYNLDIKNIHATGGCIRWIGNDGGDIASCRVQGKFGILIGQNQPSDTCFSTTVRSCLVNGPNFPIVAGSIGIMMGPETIVAGCSIVNFENGIRAYGSGISISGCRIEVNTVGIFLGKDFSSTFFQVTAGHISGCTLEANDIAIQMFICSGVTIAGITVQGSTNAPSGESINGIRFDNGNNNTIVDALLSSDNNWASGAGINIAGQPTKLTCINVAATLWGFGAGVVKGNVTCINCDNPPLDTAFNDLAGIVSNGAKDGQEVLVSNSNTATFGAAVTGTGANRVRAQLSVNSGAWLVSGLAT